jgi:uncharacterized membrane protein HdeD (DUF308 family)
MVATQIHDGMTADHHPLLHVLADNWWWLLVRGIATIVFGVSAFLWPGLTLLVLVTLWGAYALVEGVMALAAALFGSRDFSGVWPRLWLGIAGLFSIAAGIIAFLWPGMTAQILLLIIGFWAIAIGAMHLWGAFEIGKEIEGEWLLALSGVLLIAFGVTLFAQPAAGALALVWLIGAFAVLIGLAEVAFAFRVKQFKRSA